MATWPSENNTGVPAGVTLLPSGGITITQPGVTVSGLKINGPVNIRANNVTLENCQISSDAFSTVYITKGLTGVVVKNCDIDGQDAGSNGIFGQGTFLNNNIYNTENGIAVAGNNTLIQGNYIHDFGGLSTSHYDGVQIDGGNDNVIVRGNTIIVDRGQTSAVMIDNYFGPISNVQVSGNLLAGGGYTIYVDAHFNSNPITNVSITDNHMGQGYWGYTNFNGVRPVHTGSVYDGWALSDGLDSQPTSPTPTPTPTPTPSQSVATEGADVLIGDANDNVINALGGDDRVSGAGGNDTLNGGNGNDTLNGDAGNDILIGGAGRDTMTGGAGNDTFTFTALSDSSISYLRDVITDFTPGQDKINISGLDANGGLSGNNDFTLLAADGAAFTGKAGELIWDTDAANDRTLVRADVNGDRVADFIIQLNGTASLSARDFIGLAGQTTTSPPPPTSGQTTVNGSESADYLTGTGGDDLINGLGGDDTLLAGAGNDTLVGGYGTDVMTGGAGYDTFKFNAPGEIGRATGDRDIIVDFTRGQDKIDLSAIDADTTVSGNQAFDLLPANDAFFSGTAGELAWRTEGGRTLVQGDVNGDGIHDFEIELSGTLYLTQADFIV